ncbi:MAG: ester cyclase, partial [Chloroflexota bacterium]|nr:ester cyclase [Chloroflexota bacterium]
HQGSFYGEAPTGKPVVVYGAFVHRVENNRISADWEYVDGEYFMRQIGALPQEG